MSAEVNLLHFFLCANTPYGFISEMEQLHNPRLLKRLFCVEGSPGCGKSTLLKRIAQEFSGQDTELIHCSFDPNSLDGVYFPHLGLAALDATQPHRISPMAPGAFETVISLYDALDEGELSRHREDLLELGEQETQSTQRYHRFLSAAGTILSDTYRIALEFTDAEKITRFVQRLFYKEVKLRLDRRGHEEVRFLSTGTPTGILMYPENIAKLCERVYLIEDDWGAVSRLLNAQIACVAMECGYDVIACRCPMSHLDKIDHLFIPALSMGFCTSNRFHPLRGVMDGKTISAQRFTDKSIRSRRERLHFNRKAAAQILLEAGSHLEQAQKIRGLEEEIYTGAMDFTKVDAVTQRTLEQLHDAAGL